MAMIRSGSSHDPAAGPAGTYLVTDDVDGHHDRAVAAGADVVQTLADQDYGGRGYTARDPEGNLWSVGSYRPEAGEAPTRSAPASLAGVTAAPAT